MHQTNVGLSFPLILIAVVVIGAGLGGLWLLSLLFNGLMPRSKPKTHAKVGAWSGFVSAVLVSAALLFGFLIIVAFFGAKVRQSHTVISVAPTEVSIESVQAQRDTTGSVPPAQFMISDEDLLLKKQQIRIAAESDEQSKSDAAIDVSAVATKNESDSTAEITESEKAATTEARNNQLQQLIASIGQFVRSNLERVGDKPAANPFGQAAKSDNGDVVIFQPSEEMVQQILGVGGQDLLKSFNSELPGRIRQTYALIPLTPPVGSTVPVRPMIAAGGLEMIANSIVSLVERAESSAASVKQEPAVLPAEADGILTVAPEIRPVPEWVTEPDGRRIVAKTKPVLAGEDADVMLTAAINEALAKHVEAVTANMNPALHKKARFVHTELPKATAKKYIIDRYERPETLESEINGTTAFQVHYALLEFPEAVDQIAVGQIRQSIQKDRIVGVGVIVGLIWLSVCSVGIGIRQWQKGTKLHRIVATPVFAMITIPSLLLTVAMLLAVSKDEMPRGPWDETPVTIDLANL